MLTWMRRKSRWPGKGLLHSDQCLAGKWLWRWQKGQDLCKFGRKDWITDGKYVVGGKNGESQVSMEVLSAGTTLSPLWGLMTRSRFLLQLL